MYAHFFIFRYMSSPFRMCLDSFDMCVVCVRIEFHLTTIRLRCATRAPFNEQFNRTSATIFLFFFFTSPSGFSFHSDKTVLTQFNKTVVFFSGCYLILLLIEMESGKPSNSCKHFVLCFGFDKKIKSEQKWLKLSIGETHQHPHTHSYTHTETAAHFTIHIQSYFIA